MSNIDNKDDIIYLDEDIPEIEYFEIVSIDEIIKNNPNFIAFSMEEIYNEIFNFVKTKTKTETFIKLFYEIINRKTNVNNFIIIADVNRGDYEDIDINQFISDLKKYDKINDTKLALQSKNKLWFPLKYDFDSDKLRFNANQKTVIEISENNNYIIFKEDETNIPIIGLYFYSPVTILDDYLNDKIMSHLHKSIKLETLDAKNFNNFDDLINEYKIKIPIDKIDIDDYNYISLNNLLKKYNYNLDNISIDEFQVIKDYLYKLNKNEKTEPIIYNKFDITPIQLNNFRFNFFNILKEIKKLIDLTIKSVDIINKQLKVLEEEKILFRELDITKNLYSIITNINDKNYDTIIKHLRELRINFNIISAINMLKDYKSLNKKDILNKLDELELRYELLKYSFHDLYKLNFDCVDEEHELHIGADETKYEGIPKKIGISSEKEDNYEYDDENEEIELDENQFNKFYNNQYYKIELGFLELLKMLLPFLFRMQKLSGLYINYDLIVSHIFNKYRTFEPKNIIIQRNIPNIDDEELKLYIQQPIKYILINNKNIKIVNSINEYFENFKLILYDVIAFWSLNIQKEIINDTLFLDYNKLSPECEYLWDEYGCPYDLNSKKGVLIYLVCIFREVYGDIYKDEYSNLVPLNEDYKQIIIDIINTDYKKELLKITETKIKPTKINLGRTYYDKLYDLLKRKDYKGDNFLNAYIDALIYMPSIKYVKIHKYLQGCCLEKIDENFSADLYFKTERQDLKKAKDKLTGKRVFNTPRYKRFYIKKINEYIKTDEFNPIKNPIKYDIIDIDVEKWLKDLKSSTKPTIFTKELISNLLLSVFKTTENYKEQIINCFNNKTLKQLLNNYKFDNYKQFCILISKILYKYLKDKSFDFIKIINNTIDELDKLNSIITDDNIVDIINIRRISIIRVMSLPSSPENIIGKKFIPSIDIPNDIYQELFKEIINGIINIINNSKMFNLTEQLDFINQIREKNKFDILARMNKKTREEKDIEKELKKYGLKYNEELLDNEIEIDVNIEKYDGYEENEGEKEFELDMEDNESDDEYMQNSNHGFIYAD